VLALPLERLSIKVRTGPPIDIPADRSLPVWAGVIPTVLAFGIPQADALVRDPAPPASVVAQTTSGVRR
jgi:hypothetical protein